MSGPLDSGGGDQRRNEEEEDDDDDDGVIEEASLNLGESVICGCPSLWTGDCWDETRTRCILLLALDRTTLLFQKRY